MQSGGSGAESGQLSAPVSKGGGRAARVASFVSDELQGSGFVGGKI